MDVERYFNLIMAGKLEEAEVHRMESIPSKLYKYVALDGTENDEKKLYSLRNEYLWFSAIDDFNDPYEQRTMLTDREIFYEAGYPDEVIDIYEGVWDYDDLKVSCLTNAGYDNLPMWAYYANNSRGFCIEYDVIKANAIHEVLYEPNRIKIGKILIWGIEYAKRAINGDEKAYQMSQAYNRLLMQNMFMKDISWRHEKEYRIVLSESNTNVGNVPISMVGLKTNRIIAGLKTDNKTKEILNEISYSIGCGIAYTTTLSPNYFSLDLVELK